MTSPNEPPVEEAARDSFEVLSDHVKKEAEGILPETSVEEIKQMAEGSGGVDNAIGHGLPYMGGTIAEDMGVSGDKS